MKTRDEIIAEINRIEDELLENYWNTPKFDALCCELHAYEIKLFQIERPVCMEQQVEWYFLKTN